MQMEDLLYGAADASSYTGLMAVRVASENNQLASDFILLPNLTQHSIVCTAV